LAWLGARGRDASQRGKQLLRTVRKQRKQRGREKERKEREGEDKEAGLKSIFLQNLHGSSKRFEYKSCVKFQNLKLLFQAKVYLSNGLTFILNLLLLECEYLLECVHLSLGFFKKFQIFLEIILFFCRAKSIYWKALKSFSWASSILFGLIVS
jgi:hypothetical protein